MKTITTRKQAVKIAKKVLERSRASGKPVRKGKIYCSPRCGAGCTHADYIAAKDAAARLIIRLGKGWKARVWENLGWHWMVSNGAVEVVPHTGYRRRVEEYAAWFQGEQQIITEHYATPEKALEVLRETIIARAEEMAKASRMIDRTLNRA